MKSIKSYIKESHSEFSNCDIENILNDMYDYFVDGEDASKYYDEWDEDDWIDLHDDFRFNSEKIGKLTVDNLLELVDTDFAGDIKSMSAEKVYKTILDNIGEAILDGGAAAEAISRALDFLDKETYEELKKLLNTKKAYKEIADELSDKFAERFSDLF